jgi:hypothetical protein
MTGLQQAANALSAHVRCLKEDCVVQCESCAWRTDEDEVIEALDTAIRVLEGMATIMEEVD